MFDPLSIGLLLGGSFLTNWLTNRGQNKGVTFPRGTPIGDYLATGMLPESTTTSGGGSSTTTDTTQTTNMTGTSEPYFTKDFANLGGMARRILEMRLAQPNGLPPEYEVAGVRSINDTTNTLKQSLENQLLDLGQTGDPSHGVALGKLMSGRLASLANFRTTLPLVERELRNEDLGMASGFLGQFGTGTKTTQKGTVRTQGKSHTSSSSSTTQPARFDPSVLNWLMQPKPPSAFGQAAGNTLNMLAYLWANGALGGGGNPKPGVNIPFDDTIGVRV